MAIPVVHLSNDRLSERARDCVEERCKYVCERRERAGNIIHELCVFRSAPKDHRLVSSQPTTSIEKLVRGVAAITNNQRSKQQQQQHRQQPPPSPKQQQRNKTNTKRTTVLDFHVSIMTKVFILVAVRALRAQIQRAAEEENKGLLSFGKRESCWKRSTTRKTTKGQYTYSKKPMGGRTPTSFFGSSADRPEEEEAPPLATGDTKAVAVLVRSAMTSSNGQRTTSLGIMVVVVVVVDGQR
jgi:hypothetical protein